MQSMIMACKNDLHVGFFLFEHLLPFQKLQNRYWYMYMYIWSNQKHP